MTIYAPNNFYVPGGSSIGNRTSSSNFVLPTGGTSPVIGDVIVVCIAADNAGTAGASAISSVTDSQSHSYTLKTQNRTAAAASNDGVTAGLAWAKITNPMVPEVDTITINFSPNVTAKGANFTVLRNLNPNEYSSSGVSGTGTTAGNVATASLNNGDCVLAVVASESSTYPSFILDDYQGGWAGIGVAGSGSTGQDSSNVSCAGYFKAVTGAGTQTPIATTTNSDWAVVWALLPAVETSYPKTVVYSLV